jgi:hypothetical protein
MSWFVMSWTVMLNTYNITYNMGLFLYIQLDKFTHSYKKTNLQLWVCVCVCVCVCGSGVSTQGLMFATQMFYHLNHAFCPFYFHYVLGEGLTFMLLLRCNPPIYVSRCTLLCPTFIGWKGSWEPFAWAGLKMKYSSLCLLSS